MSILSAFARDWMPPVIFRQICRIYVDQVRFEGRFHSWEEAALQATGYDAEAILTKVLAATLKVKRGEAAFERDSALFDEIVYAWPVLAGLMWTAARNGGRLNVLDFGGALGSSYFQNRKFLRSLPEVRWNVVEQPHFVETGLKNVQDDQLRFYKSIDECLTENRVNAVLLSGVLQYLPSPFDVLGKLASINADTLILDRTSFSLNDEQDIIRMQHVPENIYKASYPCYVFNENKLRQFILEKGFQLTEAFAAHDKFDSNSHWRGHIYKKTDN